MLSSLLLLLACSSGPILTGIDDADLHPGQSFRLAGDGFEGSVEVFVAAEGIEPTRLEAVKLIDHTTVEARIPPGLAVGTYRVGLRQDGRDVLLPTPLQVVPLPDDAPCNGEYTANTQLSLARELVVIDRFYRTSERETVRIELDDIDKIDYELQQLDDGTRCSAIFLHTKDGRRVVFADDTSVELKERAYKLGRDIERRVEVTRQDAPGLAIADEGGEAPESGEPD